MFQSDDVLLFVEFVNCGSFTKAAHKLDVSHSAISKRITKLEARLGTPLLYRSTRSLTLTDAGKAFYQQAVLAKAEFDKAFAVVRDRGDKLQGALRVSAPTVSGDLLVADIVARFCREHPSVHIELCLSNRQVNLIEEGFDLVIRTAVLPDSNLVARHLIESHWVICASPQYLQTAPELTHPGHLQNHHCLCYSLQETGAAHWPVWLDNEVQTVTVSGHMACDSTSGLRHAARAHLGVIYVPQCLVHDDLRNGELIELLPGYAAKKLGIYAVYPNTKTRDRKITTLVEFLREGYAHRRDLFEPHR